MIIETEKLITDIDTHSTTNLVILDFLFYPTQVGKTKDEIHQGWNSAILELGEFQPRRGMEITCQTYLHNIFYYLHSIH